MENITMVMVGIFIVMVGIIILWMLISLTRIIIFYLIANRLKKHRTIYGNFSKRHKFGYFLLAPSTRFGFYSKNKFNKIFDRLYFYKDIKKTKDIQLLHLVDRCRRFTWLDWFLFNIFFSFVIFCFIIVIIIAIMIMVIGGVLR